MDTLLQKEDLMLIVAISPTKLLNKQLKWDDITLERYRCNVIESSLRIAMTSQWAWWRLKSPASRFTQPFTQEQIKGNI